VTLPAVRYRDKASVASSDKGEREERAEAGQACGDAVLNAASLAAVAVNGT
jgi:hypothetical protein